MILVIHLISPDFYAVRRLATSSATNEEGSPTNYSGQSLASTCPHHIKRSFRCEPLEVIGIGMEKPEKCGSINVSQGIPVVWVGISCSRIDEKASPRGD
jgi:hypothetical protein